VDEATIAGWLAEYEAAGMVERWEESGRQWAYLSGWFGPHGQRRRPEYDPNGTPAQQKGSKRRATPPSERKGNQINSRGGTAAGSSSTGNLPAPAVAVAVAVPDAVAAEPAAAAAAPATPTAAPPAQTEWGGDRPPGSPGTVVPFPPADPWREAKDWRRALEALLLIGGGEFSASTLGPAEWAELAALVKAIGGPAAAATWCADRRKDRKNGKKPITSLAYFLPILREAVQARAPPKESGREFLRVDEEGNAVYREHA
jgi:hypothetical protein